MNWKSVAIDKLKDYGVKQIGIQNMSEEIQELKVRRRGIRSASADSIAVHGGGSGREDAMLNSIVLQKELEINLQGSQRWIKRVKNGLSILDEEERRILERFYINPERGAAERLSMDLGVDVKTVYHRKDRALRKFTIAMYGVSES